MATLASPVAGFLFLFTLYAIKLLIANFFIQLVDNSLQIKVLGKHSTPRSDLSTMFSFLIGRAVKSTQLSKVCLVSFTFTSIPPTSVCCSSLFFFATSCCCQLSSIIHPIFTFTTENGDDNGDDNIDWRACVI